jgi:hypothetical protein
MPAKTGDSQLDRLSSIDVDQVRDQRGLGAPVAANGAPPSQPGQPGAASAAPAPSGQPLPPGPDQPKETAIYKKWWFWTVVAVSGVVVYELATSSSKSSTSVNRPVVGGAPGGLTLLRW